MTVQLRNHKLLFSLFDYYEKKGSSLPNPKVLAKRNLNLRVDVFCALFTDSAPRKIGSWVSVKKNGHTVLEKLFREWNCVWNRKDWCPDPKEKAILKCRKIPREAEFLRIAFTEKEKRNPYLIHFCVDVGPRCLRRPLSAASVKVQTPRMFGTIQVWKTKSPSCVFYVHFCASGPKYGLSCKIVRVQKESEVAGSCWTTVSGLPLFLIRYWIKLCFEFYFW